MATTTERILQSSSLESAVGQIAPREFGLTADTERPVIGTTVAGAKYIGTEELISIITAAPAPLAQLKRSRVMCFVDTQAAGANVALDIQAGAQIAGYVIKVIVSGPVNRLATVTYGIALVETIPTGTAQEFMWDGIKWNKTAQSWADTVSPRGYIDGLILSNSVGDVDHDISIAAGEARDSTDVATLTLAAAIIKQLDAAWSVGTNAGGLDTGAIGANAVYYVWIIRKDSDRSIDALFSLSATAPTMPAGYTYKRRIGTVLTDAASKIINFEQIDDSFYFKQPIIDRAIAVLANTNRNAYPLTAPPSKLAIVNIQAIWGAAAADHYIWIAAANYTDAAASASNKTIHTAVQSAPVHLVRNIKTDASKNIFARGDNTGINFELTTLGWIDDRGKDL